jgi:hypothetical protein
VSTKAADVALEMMQSGYDQYAHEVMARRRSVSMEGEPPAQVAKPSKRIATFSVAYLAAFGYLKKELAEWSDISAEDIQDALERLQEMFGLAKTRKFDIQTAQAMQKPRCGCADVEDAKANVGLRAATDANLAKWRKDGVTYRAVTCPPQFTLPAFATLVDRAFAGWAKLSPLKITSTSGEPDILVGSGVFPSGQPVNFDGAGGVLAWADVPDGNDQQLRIMLDPGEIWQTNPAERGFNVVSVLAHEAGHTLGMSPHSRNPNALMSALYTGHTSPQPLDDVPRFQVRYGVAVDDPEELITLRLPKKYLLAALEEHGYKM